MLVWDVAASVIINNNAMSLAAKTDVYFPCSTPCLLMIA